jgi:hypothetical protein
VYNHCNKYNISIYFCNIHTKPLQHTSETTETLETYACNMRFQRNVTLLLGRMELVVVELNAGLELDAMEYAEVVGAELDSGTDLGSGRSRRMEARGTGGGGASGVHHASCE